MMARGAHDSGENEKSELINNFLRSRARSAYNIDLLEQKYRRIEEQGLQTGVEIDFVNDVVYAPKRALRKLKKCERKEFGLSKISAPCNSLEVFGKGYAKRAKECRQLDHDFDAKFRMKFPGWQPYEPRKRPLVKRTIRETVKELVFDDPLDYLHYLMKIKGLPSHIFEPRGILPLPMVAGDCSKSRECSPVRNSLTAGSPALPNLMVTSSEDCSRSRECSPVRNSVAFEDARTLPNLMITNKDCSKSRECSPDGSFGSVTEPSHTREVSLCSRDHAPEEDTCYNADSNKDPAERNSSTGITKSDTAPVTPPHVTEKTAKVAVSIRKEVPLSSKVSPINSDSGCASPSSVDVSDTLPRQEDTRPGICKAPVTVFKSSLSVMPSASTQVGHSSSTSRASMATGRCRQKRSAGNTETKASKLGASPEVTPTTSKTLTRSVSRRENKQTTAKSKKVATPTSRGNITRQKSDPLPAVAPAPNTDRTPATPVAVGRRQQKHSAQKADSKVPKLRAQLEVTPAISKTVPRDASRRGSNTAKRRKATSTPVVNSLSVCNTPTIDGGASKKRLNSAEDASPSLPTGVSGSTRSCSASASRSQWTGKKVRQLRGRILRNARDESISPTLNISLSRNCSSPVSSDIAIRKSSLRPRAKAVKAQPSPATTPAAKSDLIPNTSIKVTRSVSRSAKDLRRRRSLKLRATPATPCGIKSSLEKSKNRCRRRRTSPKSTALQSSPLPGTMLTSNNSPMEQEDARDRNCSSTMATTSSTTRKRKSDGSDPTDTSFLPSEAPNGLWDESVQTILKSYEESVPAKSGKMTILGFDAQEFRKHCGDASQTTLSSFVNFARECQDFCGENYLDNGLKEDRRAMAAAKSRNRVLKDGYFA